jgi:Fe-S cluster biosynthesis and repair protein YggX
MIVPILKSTFLQQVILQSSKNYPASLPLIKNIFDVIQNGAWKKWQVDKMTFI